MVPKGRHLSFVLVVFLVTVGGSLSGRTASCPYDADEFAPAADDERIEKRALTIDGGTYEFSVLVPPGYRDPGNTMRYPVLYLMPGGFWSEDTWFSHEGLASSMDVIAFTASQPLDRHAILVSPDDHEIGAYVDWSDGSQLWETFHVRTLVPWMDANYRTIADRGHRALLGFSGGGISMAYAARFPEIYGVAGVISGLTNLTMAEAVPHAAPPIAFAYTQICPGPNGSAQGPYSPWLGNPVTDDLRWHEHDATDLAPNFGATAVWVRVGNGVPCDAVRDAEHAWNPFWHVEPLAKAMNENFDAALTRAGVEHEATFLPCGVHDFPYVRDGFRAFWEFFWEHLGRPDPTVFDHRSAAATFTVWGWTFVADPARADEFFDVTDASAAGVTLTGSGVETVTTAGYFLPGSMVTLTGAIEPNAVADETGRITFRVDLGPAHEFQQYTAPARALEALSGYWTSSTVTFSPEN